MSQGLQPVDWGMGETLAYATLLEDGFDIRLDGQDAGRGTFVHRHAVLHDQAAQDAQNEEYLSLAHLPGVGSRIEVIDSTLSEEAVLAFEYGYSTSAPEALVIWEAQFGDFANGAQAVIDQFISAGESKWQRLSALTLLLPHGYEGQGPEHSSARLERYLQLCAQKNMQVVVPSSAAQIFHLLRRQVIRSYRKPLIVMSPKSLLRNKAAMSPLSDFTEGRFLRGHRRRHPARTPAGWSSAAASCTGNSPRRARRPRARASRSTWRWFAWSSSTPSPASTSPRNSPSTPARR